jgi:hypothetical protein
MVQMLTAKTVPIAGLNTGQFFCRHFISEMIKYVSRAIIDI